MDVDKRIIEEGKRLIELNGFRKFTMDELAQNLRISKKTIYIHFKNKDQLISSIIDSIIANDLAEMKRIINEKDDFVEKLRAVFFIYHIRMLRKKYLHELKQFFPDDWKKLKVFSENRREFVREIYYEGVTKGVFINKLPQHLDAPKPLKDEHIADLLFFNLTAIIDQAIETELSDYDFDINTLLMYSYDLLINMFVHDKTEIDSPPR
ncbi:TetR/AcrR family transcriptional regulator [Bacillus sp. S/N-304-OC-R1]|uniref:TetR/AcrR family transcriptional regulator n=1 Tax=Bacillus sp. S/N-304-OC-R1 TaxID=2758034 RepID=UPI001C8EF309|nr:TetR/AcrR family transcriptional regulator [Bacillus sp. S/N-304-OC-R1]MBY0121118.1 TetR/AcrR family transcriptional regulator [Bacillus sp. S/N-304-OC-R1]